MFFVFELKLVNGVFDVFCLVSSLDKFVSWVVILVNVCFCEFALRHLIVSPVAMASLHAFGWYDVLWIYSCLLVFLVWFLCQVC